MLWPIWALHLVLKAAPHPPPLETGASVIPTGQMRKQARTGDVS